MYGCDNFCSYCIVPFVRGKEVSRLTKDIIEEIKGLADRAIKDVTLLGQNVNSYKSTVHPSTWFDYAHHKSLGTGSLQSAVKELNFVNLLKMINDIKGIKKISFVTSHPKDATIELFKAIEILDKVDKHLHLPFQSGSNRILKLMNRGYTIEKYKQLAQDYKKIVRKGKLTTDVIVGFPTETENDFNQTKKTKINRSDNQ